LLEYNERGPIQFYDYSALPALNFPEGTTIYILANGATRYMSNFSYDDLPRCIKNCYEKNAQKVLKLFMRVQKLLFIS